MGHSFGGVITDTRQAYSANTEECPHRTMDGFDHGITHCAHEALKRKIQFFGLAAIENNTEFAARISGYAIAHPHDFAQTLTQFNNHIISNLIAIGFIHDIEIVDGQNSKGTRGFFRNRNGNGFAEGVHHAVAVHHTGQGVAIAQIVHLLVTRVALICFA